MISRIGHSRVRRDASPSAAIIDSQSVKTTEAGGPRGYDAGKKINGRKRHALVDTDGRGLVLEPHPASVQDRDGGGPLLSLSHRSFPFIERVFADSGYAGEKIAKATLIAVEIVRKNPIRSASPLTRGAGSSSGSLRTSAAHFWLADRIEDRLRSVSTRSYIVSSQSARISSWRSIYKLPSLPLTLK
jgi:hypothetical protein